MPSSVLLEPPTCRQKVSSVTSDGDAVELVTPSTIRVEFATSTSYRLHPGHHGGDRNGPKSWRVRSWRDRSWRFEMGPGGTSGGVL